MRLRILVCLVLAVTVAGCSDRRSVLDEGIQLGATGNVHRIGPAEARAAARRDRGDWERELRERALEAPDQRFSNLRPETFKRRLQQAAERYRFEIVSVELPRPKQLAPRVVVRTTHYVELAEATSLILRSIDPRASTGDDRTGWSYEGFYLEARDERGIPFLITSNFWRGTGGGGSQWARSERLFAAPHG